MDLSRLIHELSKPSAYPFPVDVVDVRHTHISVVFLAGDFVYKIKKPLTLGFLDFSTVEKRRYYCEEEVRLNRRLAPLVYLGVVPIALAENGVRLEGHGEIVEWAVKMERLPEDATILAYLLRDEVDEKLIESLAARIAAFHRAAESNERLADAGRSAVVFRTMLDIFAQSESQIDTTVHSEVFGRIRARIEESLAAFRLLIDARANQGMTRDCHGDLHLDHVYFFRDRKPPSDLVIIDCIEFNERLRLIDLVADMAFVVMDLAFHGRRDLVRAFANAYFDATGDEQGRALLPLYTAYRATVRGMVEGLELTEKEVPEADRSRALVRSKAHWLLALTELERPARKPCLLLVTGLPGTGKSRLAHDLAKNANFDIIRSDVIRKQLAGLSSSEPTPSPLQATLYSEEWNDRTYTEGLIKAKRLLFHGQRVIVDATFREEHRRQDFLKAGLQMGVPTAILVCIAEPETVRKRLEQRRGDASDADWSVYLRVSANWEPASMQTSRTLHAISTDGTHEQILAEALDKLRLLGLFE